MGRGKVLAVLFGIILAICVSGSAASEQHMTAHFFYVGQAEAVLLQGPDFTVLVDAGDVDRYDVVPLLQRAGVEQIDVVIITHPHADHMGQLKDVLAAIPVKEVWMSGYEHPTPVFEDALDAILASDAGYYEPHAGEVIQMGSLTLEILNPAELTDDVHESAWLCGLHSRFAVLPTGDIEATERRFWEGTPKQSEAGTTALTSTDVFFCQSDAAIYSAAICSPWRIHIEVVERIFDRALLYTARTPMVQSRNGRSNYWITTEREPSSMGRWAD